MILEKDYGLARLSFWVLRKNGKFSKKKVLSTTDIDNIEVKIFLDITYKNDNMIY